MLSRTHLFPTPWPVAHQAPLSVGFFFQARILEWVAISFSRRSSWPRDRTLVSYVAGRFFTTEPPGKPGPCLNSPLYHALDTVPTPEMVLHQFCRTKLNTPWHRAESTGPMNESVVNPRGETAGKWWKPHETGATFLPKTARSLETADSISSCSGLALVWRAGAGDQQSTGTQAWLSDQLLLFFCLRTHFFSWGLAGEMTTAFEEIKSTLKISDIALWAQ